MTIEEFLKSDPATDIIAEYYYNDRKYRIKLFYAYDEPIIGIIDITNLATDYYEPNYIILSIERPEYLYISDNITKMSEEEIFWFMNQLQSAHIYKDLNYYHETNWDYMNRLLKDDDPEYEPIEMPDYKKLGEV